MADQAREKELLGGNLQVYHGNRYVWTAVDETTLTFSDLCDRHTLSRQPKPPNRDDSVITACTLLL